VLGDDRHRSRSSGSGRSGRLGRSGRGRRSGSPVDGALVGSRRALGGIGDGGCGRRADAARHVVVGVDDGDLGVVRDDSAFLEQDLAEDTRIRRRHLGVDLVRDDLEQRLVLGDRVTRLLLADALVADGQVARAVQIARGLPFARARLGGLAGEFAALGDTQRATWAGEAAAQVPE
jgi:hypothetical protein